MPTMKQVDEMITALADGEVAFIVDVDPARAVIREEMFAKRQERRQDGPNRTHYRNCNQNLKNHLCPYQF